MAVKIREAPIGAEVNITGIITEQNGQQSMMWVPGVGESGRWSVVSSAECEIITLPSDVMMKFLFTHKLIDGKT